MSYKVLARKWRPGNFDTMIGQSHIIQALKNSLDQDRLHHAYLFTGTRGVGKTTIARVFAKALSCEEGMSSSPCGVCSNCVSIDKGTFIDMIEVDAASRTGVDDTRDLLENVQYLPNVSRYKIYLIDEVHMFSTSSFNALLKTLEEPPEHVIFLLATTEPQKLPMTVLSRCLQFNLSRLSEKEISDYFKILLEKEKISFDDESIQLLAQAADGSVRDGLSLLDQAIAFGSGVLKSTHIKSMLGTVEGTFTQELLEAIVGFQTEKALEIIGAIAGNTTDFSRVLDALAHLLHDLSVKQLTQAELPLFAKEISAEQVQLLYQIAIKSKQDLPLAPSLRVGLEMSVLRMIAFMPKTAVAGKKKQLIKPSLKKLNPVKELSGAENLVKQSNPKVQQEQIAAMPETLSAQKPVVEKIVATQVTGTVTEANWLKVIPDLGLRGLAFEMARNSVLLTNDNKKIVLNIKKSYAGMATASSIKSLEKALSSYCKMPLSLEITSEDLEGIATTRADQDQQTAIKQQADAEVSIAEDPHVHELQQRLGAKIDPSSIKILRVLHE